MTGLQIGAEAATPEAWFELPLDAVTQTFGILAKRGAGKSNTAVVMAEEMAERQIPWVAIDPKGDWWGIRSNSDGIQPGLAVPVLGGLHGDIPLEPGAAHVVADLIVDERVSCVLDVSEFSRADQRRFLLPFAERLLRRNREPLHLFLEEAHEYLPQRVMRDQTELVGAWAKVVKQGRFRGLGCTLISQRSASLNKDVLTQVETLIVMRNTAPQDRKAIEGWVVEHDVADDLMESLPSLPSGRAWIWSPEWLHGAFLVDVRRRWTFDSGATPTLDGHARPPAKLADVDLDALQARMADTITRAHAQDPKRMARRITELERELAKAQKQTVQTVEVEKIVEVGVPIVPAEIAEGLRTASVLLAKLADQADHLPTIETTVKRPKPVIVNDPPEFADVEPIGTVTAVVADDDGIGVQVRKRRTAGEVHSVGKQKILAELFAGGAQPLLALRAPLCDVPQRGRVPHAIKDLTEEGLIGNVDGKITLAPERIATTTGQSYYEAGVLPADLLAEWCAHTNVNDAGCRILRFLATEPASSFTPVLIADAVGMAASGGGFRTQMKKLRRLDLLDEAEPGWWRIAPELVEVRP